MLFDRDEGVCVCVCVCPGVKGKIAPGNAQTFELCVENL